MFQRFQQFNRFAPFKPYRIFARSNSWNLRYDLNCWNGLNDWNEFYLSS
jgi:hypothetical protein